MRCDIGDNIRRLCKRSQGGVNLVWLFRYQRYPLSDIVVNRFDTLVAFPDTGVWEVEVLEADYTETTIDQQGNVVYQQQLNFTVGGSSRLVDLYKLAQSDYCAIFRDRNGQLRVAGLYLGCTTTVTDLTGRGKTDFNGYQIAMEGKEWRRAPYLDSLEAAGFTPQPDRLVPDLSRYGITRLFSTFKTNLATDNIFGTIVDEIGQQYVINWGDDFLPDYSDYLGVAANYHLSKMRCQITGYELDYQNDAASLVDGQFIRVIDQGATVEQQGVPALQLIGSNGFEMTPGDPLGELNYGNSFSVLVLFKWDDGVTTGTWNVINYASPNSLDPPAYRCSLLQPINNVSGGAAWQVRLNDIVQGQVNWNDQFTVPGEDRTVLIWAKQGSSNLRSAYKNGAKQSSENAFDLQYDNEGFWFGQYFDGQGGGTAKVQAVIIGSRRWTELEIQELTEIFGGLELSDVEQLNS